MMTEKIGKLNCHMVTHGQKENCVVLFHGYGADSTDLISLAEMFSTGKKVDYIFPNGPMGVAVGYGMSGRAWFQIDAARLEQAMRVGAVVDMSESIPKGAAAAYEMASEMLAILRTRYKKIIIGGFSQGAMLATDICLRDTNKPNGLILMSGTLVMKNEWSKMLSSAKSVPFFQSHGKNDAILGYVFAEKLNSFLTDGGMSGDFVAFSGGHEIPPKVIASIAQFINRQMK
jgi:phospholipase/carboxylesterase